MTHGDDDSRITRWWRIQGVRVGTVRLRGGSVVSRIVIIGGGPGGYEAALVAAQLDADVTLVEEAGAGGACVLTDCVPSKTFIASSDVMTGYRHNDQFGIRSAGIGGGTRGAGALNERGKKVARAQP